MSRYLANENVPLDAVELARKTGYDLDWIKEVDPGATDDAVLQRSVDEKRVLITFDKDFGDLAFHRGKDASCGIILLRPKLTSPGSMAAFLLEVLKESISWEGHFSVAREGRVRVVPLS
jgi:predicted nuclease of predicted toxin-antitoxin system